MSRKLLVKLINVYISLVLLLAFNSIASAANKSTKVEYIKLSYGAHQINAEVARTDDEQSRGLMWREKMNEHNGMLFIFPDNTVRCMWMKNTLIPLSVAFIDENGKIINIADMQPLSEQAHCSEREAKYALEMNLNWFQKKSTIGRNVNYIKGLPQ